MDEDSLNSDRISKLFHLQLYGQSDELDLPLNEEDIMYPESKLVSRQTSNYSERERDVGDSFHPQRTALTISAPILNAGSSATFVRGSRIVQTSSSPQPQPSAHGNPASTIQRYLSQQQQQQSTVSTTTTLMRSGRGLSQRKRVYEPGLRELPNFTLRYRDTDQVVAEKIVHCQANKRTLCFTCVGFVFATFLLLTLVISLTSSGSLKWHFVAFLEQDPSPSLKPKFALCLRNPFSRSLLSELGIGPDLESFMLHAVNPLISNRDTVRQREMHKKDNLNVLQAQFLQLTSRLAPDAPAKLRTRRTLRKLALRCSSVIESCTLSRQETISGEVCCRTIFRAVDFGLRGLCFIAEDYFQNPRIDFPFGSPHRLRVHLTNGVVRSIQDSSNRFGLPNPRQNEVHQDAEAIYSVVTQDISEIAYADQGNDVPLPLQGGVRIHIKKEVEDRYYPGSSFFGGCHSPGDFDAEIECRHSAIQMIAEKSLNCTLISLPSVEGPYSPCEPLEGFALSYILKEQEDLVNSDISMKDSFDENIRQRCSPRCFSQKFRQKLQTTIFQSPTTFVDITYNDSGLIRVIRYRLGVLQLVFNFGSLSGIGILGLVIWKCLDKLCNPKSWKMLRKVKKKY